MLSRSVITYLIDPIRPTRRHIATLPHGGLYAMPSLCGPGQDVWEWARRRADLLSLQIIRGYRECRKKSGPTYLRHQAWYWSNRDNPEFWAEWERRFPRSETEGTADNIRAELEHR